MLHEDEERSADADLKATIRPGEGRGLDFVKVEELTKRSGVAPMAVSKFAVSEMLANSLDSDATWIKVSMVKDVDFFVFSIVDNGSKQLRKEDLSMILNFSNAASSKRGIKRISRGYLGNALKCIIGYSYALPTEKGLAPRPVTIESYGIKYLVVLKPDRVKQEINSETTESVVADDACNTFVIAYPLMGSGFLEAEIIDIVEAASMLNPGRKIEYDICGHTGHCGEAKGGTQLRGETSVLWYHDKEFEALFYDYVYVDPNIHLCNFISLFRGFLGRKWQREILQSLNTNRNHDSGTSEHQQFLPTAPISALQPSDVA